MTYKLYAPLIEKIEGSLICVIEGKEKIFSNAKEFLDQEFEKKYDLTSIAARDGNIVIELQESGIIPNDLNEEWAKEYLVKTGQEISFF